MKNNPFINVLSTFAKVSGITAYNDEKILNDIHAYENKTRKAYGERARKKRMAGVALSIALTLVSAIVFVKTKDSEPEKAELAKAALLLSLIPGALNYARGAMDEDKLISTGHTRRDTWWLDLD